MNILTTVISGFAATPSDSPLFIGALTLTFVGVGTVVASFVMAVRQHDAQK